MVPLDTFACRITDGGIRLTMTMHATTTTTTTNITYIAMSYTWAQTTRITSTHPRTTTVTSATTDNSTSLGLIGLMALRMLRFT